MLASRASGSSEKYLRAFNIWAEFAKGVLSVTTFPVSPMDCALYLQFLLQSSKSASAISCAFYTFKWLDQVIGVDSPTLHPTVISTKEGALRLVCQLASHRKEPLEVTHLKQLAERTDFGNILHLRSLVMFVLAFSGFFRSSELCLICSKHVQFCSSYVTIFIEKSKTDQLRESRAVVIAETRSSTCPCYLLMAYMSKANRAGNSDDYLFRPISSSENRKRLVSVNKPISYSAYKDSFKKSFSDIVPDISRFSTHSTRSGGATLAANSGVSEKNIQRHGR